LTLCFSKYFQNTKKIPKSFFDSFASFYHFQCLFGIQFLIHSVIKIFILKSSTNFFISSWCWPKLKRREKDQSIWKNNKGGLKFWKRQVGKKNTHPYYPTYPYFPTHTKKNTKTHLPIILPLSMLHHEPH